MSRYRAIHRPVLGGKQTVSSSGINLSPLPEGSIIHVLAKQDGSDLAPLLSSLTAGQANAVRWVPPGQWFVVTDQPLEHDALATVFMTSHPQATAVDQSHGRVRIRVGGRMAERVLSKGTAVDLSQLPVGGSATTLVGHIAAHITRVDQESFELIVLRGFAESLWGDLVGMSAEYM